ncbi:MAG: histidinol dehydrogenase [Armatimonadota bacterium]|nr:histidinol dehydrogenase [Armatimonadota bacterium]
MKIFEAGRDSIEAICEALGPQMTAIDRSIASVVESIIADVRTWGDEALLKYGRQFDSPDLQAITVDESEFQAAYESVDPELINALRIAKENIEDFHKKQLRNSWIDTSEQRILGQIIRPLDRVGVYAPGGKAPYPSTVLMTALPAKVAGVQDIIMCAPPQKDGNMHPSMLVAAREAGVRAVYKVGGAPAIAAMALGTPTIPRVDKIVGPGNIYVTEAKRQLYGIVGIDMLAGPSEVLVLADKTADARLVAADLLSQAEHAEDSRAILITTVRSLAHEVLNEVKRRKSECGRQEIISASLDNFGVIVICGNLDDAVELANYCAPEHLELMVADPWSVVPKIKNAGAIMVGSDSVVSVGDYIAGPSHTLPTNGTARFGSPLCVDDFLKKSSVIWYSRQALQEALAPLTAIASAEGFDAHANAARLRIESKTEGKEAT